MRFRTANIKVPKCYSTLFQANNSVSLHFFQRIEYPK